MSFGKCGKNLLANLAIVLGLVSSWRSTAQLDQAFVTKQLLCSYLEFRDSYFPCFFNIDRLLVFADIHWGRWLCFRKSRVRQICPKTARCKSPRGFSLHSALLLPFHSHHHQLLSASSDVNAAKDSRSERYQESNTSKDEGILFIAFRQILMIFRWAARICDDDARRPSDAWMMRDRWHFWHHARLWLFPKLYSLQWPSRAIFPCNLLVHASHHLDAHDHGKQKKEQKERWLITCIGCCDDCWSSICRSIKAVPILWIDVRIMLSSILEMSLCAMNILLLHWWLVSDMLVGYYSRPCFVLMILPILHPPLVARVVEFSENQTSSRAL